MGRKGKKFVDEYPEVASMLHPTKNGGVDVSSLNQSSTQVLWWVCLTTGLEYEAKVSNQVRMGVKSPFEAGTIPIPGKNDFATMYPDLAAQWHPTKNGDLSPGSILPSSNRKVWWLCPISGGEWQATPNHRTRDNALLDSPFKQNKKLLRGYNDLASRSDVANEWHPTKNGDLTPEMVTVGSGKKVWWLCPDSVMAWNAEIKSKVTQGYGSPYMSRKRVAPGYNDVATTHPDLIKEWSGKNRNITPDMFLSGSSEKVWWECEKGHEWESSIDSRSKGSQCPQCVISGTSRKEIAMREYIESIIPDSVSVIANDRSVLSENRGKLGGVELDVLLPELGIAFEFNGDYWHSFKPEGYHEAKSLKAREKNISVFHIWEKDWDSNTEEVKAHIKEVIDGALG